MLVKVYNDNKHVYTEKFRGQTITIQPGGFVKMDHNEASLFLGTMPPNIRTDANNQIVPECFKMLRIDVSQDELIKAMPEVKKFVCQFDGKEFNSQEELEVYTAENHADKMVDEEAREKLTAKRKGRPPKGG